MASSAAAGGGEEEVRREIWAGHVPLRLQLYQSDTNSLEPPLPFYIMAPRNSYLPLVLSAAKMHFAPFLPLSAADTDMWLDYQGIPLKWHLPTGMLYDMLAKSIDLPWNVTVHFSSFPDSVVLRLMSEEAMRSRFFHTLKEATAVRWGTTKKINSLSIADTNTLWEAVKNHDFDGYWKINNAIIGSSLAPSDTSDLRSVPLRIQVSGVAHAMQHSIPLGDGSVTLGTALRSALPELFAEVEGVNGNPPTVQTLSEVVIQGIRPPLYTPLKWLSDHLSSIDNFLYVYVQANNNNNNAAAPISGSVAGGGN